MNIWYNNFRIEYVDCLGRSRTCLKKDLKYCQSRDKEYKRDESPEIQNEKEKDEVEETNVLTEEQQLLSDDMRREMLREQWEKEEMELKDKDNIHYQDILFNGIMTYTYLIHLLIISLRRG